MKFFCPPKDERVQGEINHIYSIGFFILSFGILADLILQCTSFETRARPLELITLIGTNILCVILMIRKGFADGGVNAEADRFLHAHYLIVSAAAGLISGVVVALLLMFRLGGDTDYIMAALISTISIFLFTAPLIYIIQYLCFRAAKKRRSQIEQEMNNDEK